MLKTLLLILIVFYSVRFVSRLLIPLLFKSMVKKAKRNMRPNEPKRKEGEVSIDKASKQNKKSSSSVGEYVDFEEIDENS
jgi:hypothetical protein